MKFKIKSPRVLIFSILALAFVALAYFIDWLFLIGAVALIVLNHRELMKKNKNRE